MLVEVILWERNFLLKSDVKDVVQLSSVKLHEQKAEGILRSRVIDVAKCLLVYQRRCFFSQGLIFFLISSAKGEEASCLYAHCVLSKSELLDGQLGRNAMMSSSNEKMLY